MLKTINLKKDYNVGDKTVNVLKNVNLTIQDGSITAIMGVSGSGKTTLLNILGVIDSATSGEYYYDDVRVDTLSRSQIHEFRKEKFSYIFQQYELFDRYTVYENLEVPLIARGIKNYRKKIMETLGIVGLGEKFKMLAGRLSGGEKQRCAIARAIVADTPVILADEPTGALDADNTVMIMDLLKKTNEMGKTIVIVTHDEYISARSDKLFCIKDGIIF